MRWADAVKASPCQAAKRLLTDANRSKTGEQPNVVLLDEGRYKAFRALDEYAWMRRGLKGADAYDDWQPALDRGTPRSA